MSERSVRVGGTEDKPTVEVVINGTAYSCELDEFSARDLCDDLIEVFDLYDSFDR